MDSRNQPRRQSGPRRVNTTGARGKPAYDQQIEPFPVPKRKKNGEMQQVVLPLGGAPSQPPPDGVEKKKRKKKKQSRRPAANENQTAARRRVGRGELRRRRRRRRVLTVILVLLLIGVGLTLSVTVLFKVKEFRVENLDKTMPANTGIYTEEAILGALAVPVEQNMFQFSAKEREQAMAVALPYLETVRVRRSLPSTLVVQVAPAVETWCAETDAGWLVLSEGLKIMKIEAAQPDGLPVIRGLQAEAPQAGYPLTLILPVTPAPTAASAVSGAAGTGSEAAGTATPALQQAAPVALNELRSLLDELQAQGLDRDCGLIDLLEENEAYIVYQNRIKVLLGTFNSLDYKLSVAGKLLRNETGEFLGASDRGTLDVSHQLDGSVVRIPFSPGDFSTEPAKVPPEDIPENEPSPEPQSDPAA